MEKAFYFQNKNQNIFAVWHIPEKSNQENQAYVMCHAFAEEKLWSHRVMVSHARNLAQAGYPVLRFDFRGHGDSDGSFEDATIQSRLSDIKAAIKVVKEEFGENTKIGLIGLRFGATLSILYAQDNDDIDQLILWDPILNGEKYMGELLRMNLMTQTAVYKTIKYDRKKLIEQLKAGQLVNIDGYLLSWEMYEGARQIDLSAQYLKTNARVLIIPIGKKPDTQLNKYLELAKKLNDGELVPVDEEPFWKEIKTFYDKAPQLMEVTNNWIGNHVKA